MLAEPQTLKEAQSFFGEDLRMAFTYVAARAFPGGLRCPRCSGSDLVSEWVAPKNVAWSGVGKWLCQGCAKRFGLGAWMPSLLWRFNGEAWGYAVLLAVGNRPRQASEQYPIAVKLEGWFRPAKPERRPTPVNSRPDARRVLMELEANERAAALMALRVARNGGSPEAFGVAGSILAKLSGVSHEAIDLLMLDAELFP